MIPPTIVENVEPPTPAKKRATNMLTDGTNKALGIDNNKFNDGITYPA
jgi:hypothetical protein